MSFRQVIRIGAALSVVASAMTAVSVVPTPAQSAAPTAACVAPAELTRLDNPLNRIGQRLTAGQPIKIVAIGSSSTFGAGASSAAAAYPSQPTCCWLVNMPSYRFLGHGGCAKCDRQKS